MVLPLAISSFFLEKWVMILLGLQPSKEGGIEEKRKKWEKGQE